jgi:hypothetical protein
MKVPSSLLPTLLWSMNCTSPRISRFCEKLPGLAVLHVSAAEQLQVSLADRSEIGALFRTEEKAGKAGALIDLRGTRDFRHRFESRARARFHLSHTAEIQSEAFHGSTSS